MTTDAVAGPGSADRPTARPTGQPAARPDADLTPPPGRERVVVTDDGAALAVTDAGPAGGALAPVVLPHCWTGTRAVWSLVARRLVDAGHRVVLFDQRGHGASGTGSAGISVDRLGDDLAAVVRGLDLRDAVVAGHSMGGMSTMSFACRHPDLVRARVRALALVATAAHGLAGRGRDRMWRMLLWRDLIARVMARPRPGYACVRGTFGAAPERAHVDATRLMFVRTPSAVRRDCMVAMGEMDLRAALRCVDVTAHVLLGRRDTLIVPRLTRAIIDHIPGARLTELDGAGHMLPLERPDEVTATIRVLAG